MSCGVYGVAFGSWLRAWGMTLDQSPPAKDLGRGDSNIVSGPNVTGVPHS